MPILLGLLAPLQMFNDVVLRIGRGIGIVAMAAMVIAILIQVFFRYVLNNALPWPDEAARFAMLWMTGLVAPTAYRRGGFVAIDMAGRALPEVPARILSLILFVISLTVLLVAVQLGWKHVNSGWLFNSSSLRIPLHWIGIGESATKIKLAWMYMSLFIGVVLLTLVNIEFILRDLISLLGGRDRLRPQTIDELGAE